MTDSLLQCLIHSAAFLEHLTLHSLVCVCMCLVMSDSLQPCGLSPTRLFCPWDFSGKNTGVGCHFLPQGIFPTQGSNPHLLPWQADSLPLSHLESPYSCTSSFLFLKFWAVPSRMGNPNSLTKDRTHYPPHQPPCIESMES